MKKTLLALLAWVGMQPLSAQDVLDNAYLECKYSYKALTDTLHTPTEEEQKAAFFRGAIDEDVMVLLVGEHGSHFYSYNHFRRDSVLKSNRTDPMMAMAAAKSFPSGETWHIYKNLPAGTLTFTDRIVNYYKYEEPYEPQAWTLSPEAADTLQGYACMQAVCHFRGRTYRAWFTPEIPVSEGPWKFNGLPGLILKVQDEAGHYTFELIGLRQVSDTPIVMESRKWLKATRQDYLKVRREFRTDPVGYMNKATGGRIVITPTNKEEKELLAPKELKYDFMETDYR